MAILGNPASILVESGSEALTFGFTAQPWPASDCRELHLKSPATNLDAVKVGNATTRVRMLEPGDTLKISIDNANKVVIEPASGSPVVYWMVIA